MKIMTLLGTRPEIIKLSRVMDCLDRHAEHTIVHTGQNYDYELNGVFFEQMRLRAPDRFLEAAGATAAETIGAVIARADRVFEEVQPHALLVLGDTNSALAVIPAKRRKIPIFHMEAGNRCFDARVPEEVNRRIVDHVSDINLPYTEHARRNLLAEGLPPDRVIKTGSPQKEVLDHYRPAIEASDAPARLGVEPGRYFVASLHREENVDDPARLGALAAALEAVAARHGMPVIFSAHPRTQARLRAAGLELDGRVRVMPPLGLFDYAALEKHAYCTLSDSGTISEESAILGFPAVTLREAHERPEAMDEGTVVMTGLNAERILESIELTVDQFRRFGPSRLAADYNVDQVSWKVAKIVFSYVDYVNRRTWFKPEAFDAGVS